MQEYCKTALNSPYNYATDQFNTRYNNRVSRQSAAVLGEGGQCRGGIGGGGQCRGSIGGRGVNVEAVLGEAVNVGGYWGEAVSVEAVLGGGQRRGVLG